jgi:preprotein translocase subunit SecA
MRIERETAEIADQAAREKKIAEIKADVAAKKEIALKAGGLFVVGTERHESRRIDNQLRGRSGRQGDPGASRFFLSLEDDLMRIFGSERMDTMLKRLGLEEGEAIVHPWINKALEKAQQKVEARNFDIRKNLLKFDNVMNDQRKVIYEQRRDLMQADDLKEEVTAMRHEVIDDLIARYIPEKAFAEQWDTAGLHEEVLRIFNLNLPFADWAKEEGIDNEAMRERLVDAVDRKMAEKAANFGPEILRMAEKSLLMQILDQSWKEHLLALDHLRHGIGLRAYGQRDPLNEYKREAFEMFEAMLARLREQVTLVLSHIEIRAQEELQAEAPQQPDHTVPPAPAAVPAGDGIDPNDPATWRKLSRNANCPCGSGKKYKHCHGRLA